MLIFIVVWLVGFIVTGFITAPQGEDKDNEIILLGWFIACILFPVYWVIKAIVFTKLLLGEST